MIVPVVEDHIWFVKLSSLAQLSMEDVPSGTIAGSKNESKWLVDDKVAQHWRFTDKNGM